MILKKIARQMMKAQAEHWGCILGDEDDIVRTDEGDEVGEYLGYEFNEQGVLTVKMRALSDMKYINVKVEVTP